MNDLDKLAQKYGTDKWGKHHYTPVYWGLFRNREDKVKKVLEIGPAEGAGLKMFRDYFPNADIYGAEIDSKRVEALQNEARIKVFECDQADEMDIRRLFHKIGYKFDLVIDDGSHKPEDQIFTCLTMMPLLEQGPTGLIYVIEDVADTKIVNALSKYDCRIEKVGSRYDDTMILVRHK